MKLPCYCFFLLKQELFECPKKEGTQKISATIPGSYFQDFANNISEIEAANLKQEDRPAMVIISDMEKFIDMIRKKLMLLGIEESEIIVQVIEYFDKNIPFCINVNSPGELIFKDKSFSHQSEGRIIINTDNQSIRDYLIENPIQIGSLIDIAQMSNTYFYDGILVEMTADVYKIQ